jgi:DNA invertase Pin-like site-specific DNA recombinase
MRTILYARVSKVEGDQDPETQLKALRQWAAQRGWTVASEHVDRVSGDPARRKGDPPGLRAALAALRRGDVLAVFAADRLVRSPMELLQLVMRIQAHGAHVASLQDGADLDTTTDTGELLTFLYGWKARMELRLIRSRTLAGLAAARAKGKRLGRPLGSDYNASEARRLRGEGLSWADIAARLDCSRSTARRLCRETSPANAA